MNKIILITIFLIEISSIFTLKTTPIWPTTFIADFHTIYHTEPIETRTKQYWDGTNEKIRDDIHKTDTLTETLLLLFGEHKACEILNHTTNAVCGCSVDNGTMPHPTFDEWDFVNKTTYLQKSVFLYQIQTQTGHSYMYWWDVNNAPYTIARMWNSAVDIIYDSVQIVEQIDPSVFVPPSICSEKKFQNF
ncbi:hypothetical protein M0811_10144 [Anaeramoeba ignava]|uniref:Uncharacterized protein n=1 Tax=Anaeramoeba ignava TaxID=1746090 RepID=A0A9Q0LES6_ANAIG|nr:hypothetical protein M0811_10144 [Anaeramoeba ignava]|eukprot:Anaeramoba_ignava/a101833_31.p1 GENE.a101833_31~~a101833_31.p1  ORF type:complete len:202 (-),score=56.70 a101833_31:69-638(-)